MSNLIAIIISTLFCIVYSLMGKGIWYSSISIIVFLIIIFIYYLYFKYDKNKKIIFFMGQVCLNFALLKIVENNLWTFRPRFFFIPMFVLCIINILITVKTIDKESSNITPSNKDNILLKEWNLSIYNRINNLLEKHNVNADMYICETKTFWGRIILLNKKENIFLFNKSLFRLMPNIQNMTTLHEIGHFKANDTKKIIKRLKIYSYIIIPVLLTAATVLIPFIHSKYTTLYYVVFCEILFSSTPVMLNLFKTKIELDADDFMLSNIDLQEITEEDILEYTLIAKDSLEEKPNKFNLFMYSLFNGYPSKEHLVFKFKSKFNEEFINRIYLEIEKYNKISNCYSIYK